MTIERRGEIPVFSGVLRIRGIIANRRREKQDARDMILLGKTPVDPLASVMRVVNESGRPQWIVKREERVMRYFHESGSNDFTGEEDCLSTLRERYESGLKISVRQVEKLRTQKGNQEGYSDFATSEGRERFVLAHTLDFYRTIMGCKRNGVPLNRSVLLLASIIPYKFDPAIVSRLCKKYPHISPLTIVTSIINHRTNPESAIMGTPGIRGKRSGEKKERVDDDAISYADTKHAWAVVMRNNERLIGTGKNQLSDSEIKRLNAFFDSNGMGMQNISTRLLRKLVHVAKGYFSQTGT